MQYSHPAPSHSLARTTFRKIALASALSLASAASWCAPDSVSLPGDRAFPESVTSTRDGTLFAGSLATGGIVRVRPGVSEGQLNLFFDPANKDKKPSLPFHLFAVPIPN